MGKLAFIFPGQGSQYIGMGKFLYERYDTAKQIIDLSVEHLGWDLKTLCFEGSLERLTETRYAQPAIFTVSYAAFKCFIEETGLIPDIMAGHSLGEITALACAKMIDYETALSLVQIRANLMHAAMPPNEGAMSVVLGKDTTIIARICEDVCNEQNVAKVSISNYNTQEQVVISGKKDDLEKVGVKLELNGYKVIPLNVGGAFHSTYMIKPSNAFYKDLERYSYKESLIPVLSNVTSHPHVPTSIPLLLKKQLYQPVDWIGCMNYLYNFGVTDIVSLGPGKIISKLATSNLPGVKMFAAAELHNLHELYPELEFALGRTIQHISNKLVNKCLAIAVASQNYSPNSASLSMRTDMLKIYKAIEQVVDTAEENQQNVSCKDQLMAVKYLQELLSMKQTPKREFQIRFEELYQFVGSNHELGDYIEKHLNEYNESLSYGGNSE